jgi:gliding motility-associated-like protein
MKFIFKILLLFAFTANAQLGKEAWHWQFGDSCSIDFSSGTPVVGKSPLNTLEGCASISDVHSGQLLFYTDGTTVFNANNDTMPNGKGLFGGYGTSTQAALIIPKPGSNNIYYLISADQGGYYGVGYTNYPNTGVHYSIIDMNLNNGLGDVTIKNKLLTPPGTTEKLVGLRHCNGYDYWIIDHIFNTNTFNVYLVTANGIDTVPIVSNCGMVESNNNPCESAGYLKASPDNKRLALVSCQGADILEIFDFDNSTGIISNQSALLGANSQLYDLYGISFSPDGKKLYVSVYTSVLCELLQFNLIGPTATHTVISTKCGFQAIQIGPDNKIYVADGGDSTLSIINYPNNLGASCGFQYAGLTLSKGAKCLCGLPNFIDGGLCATKLGSAIVEKCNAFDTDTLDAGPGFLSYNWSTGDTTEKTIINSPGKYWVTITSNSNCSITDTINAYLIQPFKKDTVFCKQNTEVNVYQNNAQIYLWNDNSTNPVKTIDSTGLYWVNISYTNGCRVTDTFNIIVSPFPSLIYPDTLRICYSPSQPAILNPKISGQYIWNTGSTSSQITANNSGTYWVEIAGPYNCKTGDTTFVLLVPFPKALFGKDTMFCNGNNVLDATITNGQYFWSTGATMPSINITQPGNYWVRIENNIGCIAFDTINVLLVKNIDFKFPNIVTPNNDNINDNIDFSIYQFSSMQLEIYDRWGKKIFESEDPACIWKPTCDDGTYFYIIQYKLDCGDKSESKTLKGFITVVK